MHRATSLDREIVLTDAALLLASARERGLKVDPLCAAREILSRHPEVAISDHGLAEAIAKMLAADEPCEPGTGS